MIALLPVTNHFPDIFSKKAKGYRKKDHQEFQEIFPKSFLLYMGMMEDFHDSCLGGCLLYLLTLSKATIRNKSVFTKFELSPAGSTRSERERMRRVILCFSFRFHFQRQKTQESAQSDCWLVNSL
jgi:hypothetical protein